MVKSPSPGATRRPLPQNGGEVLSGSSITSPPQGGEVARRAGEGDLIYKNAQGRCTLRSTLDKVRYARGELQTGGGDPTTCSIPGELFEQIS
jgi:hypothetical protein